MKWTIGRKIGCGFALALTGLLLVSSFAKVNNKELAEARKWVDHTFQSIGMCHETLIAMLDAETNQRAYILTGDPTYITPYQDARARVSKLTGDLKTATTDNPSQQQRIATLNLQIVSRFTTLQEAVDKRKNESWDAALKTLSQGKETMGDLRRTLNDMIGEENSLLARRLDAEGNLMMARTAMSNFAILAAIVILTIFGVWIGQHIATPINTISEAAKRIAAGDFSVSLPSADRTDEVGVLVRTFTQMTKRLTEMAGVATQIAAGNLRAEVKPLSEHDVLGTAFQNMIENLHQTIGEVSESTNVLASAASEILASTTQVASGAAQTSAAVSETTATVEEVKQTAQMSNQKARLVSETARQAAQVAKTGQKTVDAAIHGMKRVQTQMESIIESVVRLSEQSHAIGEIIATVNDLAEQSNLLAVNAGIEAAKAGERGRGFGFVAQEIKSLAAQSKQATAQVRAILGEIQKATTASVLATEQGSKAVEAGLKESAEAGESIRLLAETISDAAQAATQISASSQQQVIGTDQVALAMANINKASSQNLAGTRQAEMAAHSLNDLGQKLKQLLSGFKV